MSLADGEAIFLALFCITPSINTDISCLTVRIFHHRVAVGMYGVYLSRGIIKRVNYE